MQQANTDTSGQRLHPPHIHLSIYHIYIYLSIEVGVRAPTTVFDRLPFSAYGRAAARPFNVISLK
jgi:hypothetical protein